MDGVIQMSYINKKSQLKKVKPFFATPENDQEDQHHHNSDGIDGSGLVIGMPNVDGYASWLVKHPFPLSTFDSMTKQANGKKVVMFLDYNDTLSPIVENPDKAFMFAEMRMAVCVVVKYFSSSIISGRSPEKVKEFVQLSDVYYAGSHGLHIMAPPRAVELCDECAFQPAKLFLPTIQEDHEILKEKVRSLVENQPEFRLAEGKMVIEVRPSIEWNKGNTLNYLLDTLGFSDDKDVLPLYVGDDRTDEDAFKVIADRREGFPIIVSLSPRDTLAWYSLRDPPEILAFLLRLVKWKKSEAFFK